jgi:hypothetical protein
MLYDLCVKPPPRSLLESVFMLITNRRQYEEFLKTRVIMESLLAPHLDGGAKSLKETFEAYAGVALPYLGKVRSKTKESAHRTLDKWTNRGPLMVRPLWEAKEGNAKKLKSALVRGAQRVQAIEEDRRRGKLKRIG